jgi:DNA-binding MarR family transcriptional regulator
MATTADAQSVRTEVWALLRTLFKQHRLRFLVAAAELELHPAQAGALLQLGEPRSMNQLAAELGCDNSNVTGLVDRLAARGLVSRRANPDDRRVRQVVLTAAGRRTRERLLKSVGQPMGRLDRLSDAEQSRLLELLRRMVPDADSV